MPKDLPKKNLIADAIAGDIYHHVYHVGDRLPSVRSLCGSYHVSSKVIQDAFTLLSRRHLIRRHPRSGVFVCDPHVHENIRVIIILPSQHNSYLEGVLNLMAAPYREPGFDFSCRIIGCDFTVSASRTVLSEMRRIIQESTPDFLLIAAPKFQRPQIREFLNLGVPLLFIGDFAQSDDILGECLQITEDNYCLGESAVVQVGAMAPERKLVCLSGDSDYFFYRETLRGFQEAAIGKHLETLCLTLPHGFTGFPAAKQKELVSGFQQEIKDKGFQGAPIVNFTAAIESLCHYGADLSPYLFITEETEQSRRRFYRQIYRLLRLAYSTGMRRCLVSLIGSYHWKPYVQASSN